MFDDIYENEQQNLSFTEETPKKSYTPKTNYYPKKEDIPKDPYIPVSIFIDKDYPNEVKDTIFDLINKLLAKKITVRINADDLDFYNRIKNLSDKHLEFYIPWKGFNDIATKYYYNTATAKHVASINFLGWDKLPDAVKSILARNVRMIFGDKNNSISLCVILWSKDGANKLSEITKETGRLSFVIKTACTYGFPVINLNKQNAISILEKTFGL